MAKKINCKDGLGPKEEIQARRLKDKLISNDLKNSSEKIKFNYEIYEKFKEYSKERKKYPDFNSFMKLNYPIIYSACKRINLDLMEIVIIMHN